MTTHLGIEIYRHAAEAAGIGIVERDCRTGQGVWTAEAWAIHGRTPREHAPSFEELLDVVHPDDRAAWLQEQHDLATDATRAKGEIRFRIIRPDGVIRHITCVVSYLRDAEGNPVTLRGVFIDSTERRAAEEALAANEARFRHAVDAAGQGVFERDLGKGVAVWSPRLWEIAGLPPRETGPTWEEGRALVHPEDRERLERAYLAAASDPAANRLTIEFRAMRADGSVRHLVQHTFALRNAGSEVSKIYGVISDVTEQRLAAEATRASEARFRLAVASADLGVYERDRTTGLSIWSPRMWEIFGLPPRETGLTTAEIDQMIHPQDRERTQEANARALESDQPERTNITFRIIRPDGAVRHLDFNATGERDADGMVRKVYGVVSDVTEHRAAEAGLAATEMRLRLAVQAAGLGVFERDPLTDRSIWSPRMWEIYGMPPREYGLSLTEIRERLHPEDFARVRDARLTAMDDPSAARMGVEFRIIRPDGQVRYLATYASGARDETGLIRTIYGVAADITERREAEAAIADSEMRVRLAVTAAGQGIFERDLVRGRVVWSDRMWEIYGLAPRDACPAESELEAMVHPDDIAEFCRKRDVAVADPQMFRLALAVRIIRPDGALRHITTFAAAVRDASGAVIKIYGVVSDVTEQRLAEEAMAASEMRFRLAVASTDQGVFERDLVADRAVWSPRQVEIYGVIPPPEGLTEAAVRALMHPDDRERIRLAREEAARDPSLGRLTLNFRIVRPDGEIRHVITTSLRTFDASGRAVKIYGVTSDVTERRQAEDALMASEMRLRLAVTATNQGVFERDLLAETSVWSKRQWEIYGLEPRPIGPSEADILDMIHPDDRTDAWRGRDYGVADPSLERLALEFRIIRPDGAVRHVIVSSVRVFDETGQATKIYGVTSDVTDERELRAQALISDNLTTLGQMATGIAHEFGQPLQAIATLAATAQVLLENAGAPALAARVQPALGKIEEQAERLGKTMKHLLAFGRGEPAVGDEVTTAMDAVSGALDLVGKLLKSAGVLVRVDLPAGLPPVHCGKLELERVMLNLLLNARDAMEDQREQQVTISGRLEGDLVRIDVDDTGDGFPDAIINRVFDPFFTTKEVGRGTGLGLSLCRSSVEANGGTISAGNTATGGRITLRLRPAAEA